MRKAEMIKMTENDGKILEEKISQYLNTKHFGREVHIFEQIDSTNNYAKKIASEGAPHGSLVIAEMQNAGRGRLGRSFFSPKDSGIYFTLIIRQALMQQTALLITTAISVAVCRAIDRMAGVITEIKWVNDIYLCGKKICGILTEGVSDAKGETKYVVVGVGINVLENSFPGEIKDIATSILNHSDRQIDRNELIAQIMNEFEKIYENIVSRSYMKEYRQRSIVIGREVYAVRGDEKRRVFVEDIDDDGALVIRGENGAEKINSGEISIRAI